MTRPMVARGVLLDVQDLLRLTVDKMNTFMLDKDITQLDEWNKRFADATP